MKSMCNQLTRDELINRIHSLHEGNDAKWGKMNIFQMVRHCLLWDEMALGKIELKRAFIGRLFGKIALKGMIKDEKPLSQNIGSLTELIVADVIGDLDLLKKQWMNSVQKYAHLSDEHQFVHSFFGELNKSQTGLLAYKHTDHHLRQFGV